MIPRPPASLASRVRICASRYAASPRPSCGRSAARRSPSAELEAVASAVVTRDAAGVDRDRQTVAPLRHDHALVELLAERPRHLFHETEVEHVAVGAEVGLDAHRHLIVGRAALAKARVRDEMRGRELR
jgi:hypothetical protein